MIVEKSVLAFSCLTILMIGPESCLVQESTNISTLKSLVPLVMVAMRSRVFKFAKACSLRSKTILLSQTLAPRASRNFATIAQPVPENEGGITCDKFKIVHTFPSFSKPKENEVAHFHALGVSIHVLEMLDT